VAWGCWKDEVGRRSLGPAPVGIQGFAFDSLGTGTYPEKAGNFLGTKFPNLGEPFEPPGMTPHIVSFGRGSYRFF
jgi:hypothetical protein